MDYIFDHTDAPVFVQILYLFLLFVFIYVLLIVTGFWARFGNHPKHWTEEKSRKQLVLAIKNDNQKLLKWFMHENIALEFQLKAIRSIKDKHFLRRFADRDQGRDMYKAAAETLGGDDFEKYKRQCIGVEFSSFIDFQLDFESTTIDKYGNIFDSGHGSSQDLYKWLENHFEDPFNINFLSKRDPSGVKCITYTLETHFQPYDPQLDQQRNSVHKAIWICRSNKHTGYEWAVKEDIYVIST